MDKPKDHNVLLEEMRIKAADHLREMGEHGLADGTEVFNPEAMMAAAMKFHKERKQAAVNKPKKNRSQKAARRKNRK